MQTAISKLTKKYQATVPEPVRAKLKLNAGDSIAFEIDANSIRLRKATPIDLEFVSGLFPTLSEWESQNDEEEYNDLWGRGQACVMGIICDILGYHYPW